MPILLALLSAAVVYAIARSRAGRPIFDAPNPTAADLDPGPTLNPLGLPAVPQLAPAVDLVVRPVVTILNEAGRAIEGAARRVFQLPPAAAPYAEAIRAAEQRYGLPQSLLARQLMAESAYRPDVISGEKISSAGAVGIAQFMPATARDFGIDPRDPYQSIDAAGKYMRQLFDRFGDWGKALAAYNWGMGNVQRQGMARAPAETRKYVASILADVDVEA